MKNNLISNHSGCLLKHHLLAVANVGKAMGRALGLSDLLIEDIGLAGLLHNFGKATKPFQKYMRKIMGENDNKKEQLDQVKTL